MSDISARRVKRVLADDRALAIFAEWMEKGAFTKKGVIDDIQSTHEVVELCFIRTTAKVTGHWNAQVGVLNRREWERDWNTYQRDQQHWENRGRQGFRPKAPSKSDYYDWREEAGSWEDEYECSLPAFDETDLYSDAALVRACQGFNAQAWGYWRGADPIPEDEATPTLSGAQFDDAVTSIGKQRFQQWFKTNVKKRFDKALEPGFDFHYEKTRLEALMVPFFTIDFSYDRKDYRFVTDLVDGSCQGGRRPKDQKKIAWAAGIAAAVAAAGGGSYALLHDPATQTVEEPSSAALISSTGAPENIADSLKATVPQPEPAPQAATTADAETPPAPPSIEETQLANAGTTQLSPAAYQRARPLGNLNSLFAVDDYPASALDAGAAGSTSVDLTVSPQGRVSACRVVRSSGSLALDRATCAILARRARFTPAVDANGFQSEDTYSQTVQWRLGG